MSGLEADVTGDEGEIIAPARRFGLGKDTLWASTNEVGRMLSALVIFFIIARHFGPEEYGVFAGAQALASIAATLSSSSVVLFLLQETVREGHPMKDALPIALGLAAGAAVLVVALAAAIGPFLLPTAPFVAIVGLAVVEAVGAAGVAMGAGAVQAGISYAASARIWTVYLFGRTFAVLGLVAADAVTLRGVVLAQAALSLACGTGGLLYASRKLDLPLRFARPHRIHLRRTLSYSATTGGFSINEDSDKTLMVKLASEFDAGIYAAAYRVLGPVLAPVRALVTASHTRFLSDDPTVKNEHLRRAVRYTGAAAAYGVAATAGLMLIAPQLLEILGDDYAKAATVLRWVAPLVLLRTLGLFPFNALLGLRKNLLRTVIVSTCAVLNVLANIVLIPKYSWKGAAASTLGCEIVFLTFTWAAVIVYQRRRDTAYAAAGG
jgi:O-antigen/teichoic acid export membrane protein